MLKESAVELEEWIGLTDNMPPEDLENGRKKVIEIRALIAEIERRRAVSDLTKLKADRVQECMSLLNATLAKKSDEILKAYMQDNPAVRYLVARIIKLGKGSFIVDDELMTAVEGAFLELSVEGAAG